MIGRRSSIALALASLTSFIIDYFLSSDAMKPMAFSLESQDTVPILDPYEAGHVHEVNFVFPGALEKVPNLVYIQSNGPFIRCNYDLENIHTANYKMFHHPNLTFTEFPCIEVLREVTVVGSDADIRKPDEFAKNLLFPVTYQSHLDSTMIYRMFLRNTDNQTGVCLTTTNSDHLCFPSMQLTEFHLLTRSIPKQKPRRWRGTTSDILYGIASMAMVPNDLSVSAEKACELVKEAEKYPMEECQRRTEFAAAKLLSSLDQLGIKVAADKTRLISKNENVLFSPKINKHTFEVNNANHNTPVTAETNSSQSHTKLTI